MAMDLIGPFTPSVSDDIACTFVLVLVDVCTRFVYLRPITVSQLCLWSVHI
jgi:hypothetical protein